MQHGVSRWFFSGAGAALLIVVGAGCGSDEPDDGASGSDCVDSTLTYASFGRSFVSSYCASCHAGTVTGTARLGAPPADVFDTRAQIEAKAAQIKEQVVVMKAMPFGNSTPKPSAAERVKLGRWLDCGAP